MKYLSGLLRILSGVLLMGFSVFKYFDIQPRLSDGSTAEVFGHKLGISQGTLLWVLAGIGVLGLLFVLLGVLTFRKSN